MQTTITLRNQTTEECTRRNLHNGDELKDEQLWWLSWCPWKQI